LKTNNYRGIGNEYREYSQDRLLTRLNNVYELTPILNAPFDHSTDPTRDNKIFGTDFTVSKDLKSFKDRQFQCVWNFGFIQRYPNILKEMKRTTRKYVLCFVPNGYNPGMIIHRLYHITYSSQCHHPERGNPSLMTKNGIELLFRRNDLRIVESGYIDICPWFDTVVTIKELFGRKRREVIRLPFPKQILAFENLARPVARIWAHHIWCLGSIIQ